MNRLVAVLLAVAVPATALAEKPALLPSYDQSAVLAPAPQLEASQPVYTRWWLWTIVGASWTLTFALAAIMVLMAQNPVGLNPACARVACTGSSAPGSVNLPPQM